MLRFCSARALSACVALQVLWLSDQDSHRFPGGRNAGCAPAQKTGVGLGFAVHRQVEIRDLAVRNKPLAQAMVARSLHRFGQILGLAGMFLTEQATKASYSFSQNFQPEACTSYIGSLDALAPTLN